MLAPKPVLPLLGLPSFQASSPLQAPLQPSPLLLTLRWKPVPFVHWTLESLLLQQICFSETPTHGLQLGGHANSVLPQLHRDLHKWPRPLSSPSGTCTRVLSLSRPQVNCPGFLRSLMLVRRAIALCSVWLPSGWLVHVQQPPCAGQLSSLSCPPSQGGPVPHCLCLCLHRVLPCVPHPYTHAHGPEHNSIRSEGQIFHFEKIFNRTEGGVNFEGAPAISAYSETPV